MGTGTAEDSRTPIVFEGACPRRSDAESAFAKTPARAEPSRRRAGTPGWATPSRSRTRPPPSSASSPAPTSSSSASRRSSPSALTVSSLISLSAAVDPALAEPTIHLVIGQALDAASEALVNQLTETCCRSAFGRSASWERFSINSPTRSTAAASRAGRRSSCSFTACSGCATCAAPTTISASRKKGAEKTPAQHFTHFLKEGPPSSVFTMLWCDTLVNLQRCDRPPDDARVRPAHPHADELRRLQHADGQSRRREARAAAGRFITRRIRARSRSFGRMRCRRRSGSRVYRCEMSSWRRSAKQRREDSHGLHHPP